MATANVTPVMGAAQDLIAFICENEPLTPERLDEGLAFIREYKATAKAEGAREAVERIRAAVLKADRERRGTYSVMKILDKEAAR